jgi:ankyrin repeat protein
MRLLHTKKVQLQDFRPREVPTFAILSHTWGEEEVTLQDIKTKEATKLLGYEKVTKACSVAAADGFDYIWIDTCCIDKTSSAELSEALNSMYRWYQEAEECYAYLVDVPHNPVNRVTGATGPEFWESRWFTRGWTLQELIAPSSVIFLDSEWQDMGTKSDLQYAISEITGIPGSFLLGDDLRHASVAQRMSWASKRETTRIEDLAYSLMGLFGIYMPMLYGEGERAFIRLQEEIMRVSDDHSLFAWRSSEDQGGILATSPAAFANSGNIIPVSPAYATSSPRGIHLSLRFINNGQQGKGLAILHCAEIGKERTRLALHLRDVFLTNEDFVRDQSTTLGLIDLEDINPSEYPLTSLYVRQWHPMRNRNWELQKCVVKLAGVDAHEASSRVANFDPNCDLSDGLIIMNMATISDGLLGRLVVICKDGTVFQLLLSKYRGSLSADISTSTTDLQRIQNRNVLEKAQNEQDRIVKVLGSGKHVHIAIKKRVLLLCGKRCLTGVVEISYPSALKGVWLEHIAILEREVKEKTLLSYAAKRGLKIVVEHLLDRESIESNSKDDLRTPLSWAAEGGQEEVVTHLLERGAALDSKDKNGRTPLSWAAEGGQEEVVQHLLERGAALDSKDKNGRTPLSWAAGSGHVAIVRLLLAHATIVEERKRIIRDRKSQSRAGWQQLLPAKVNVDSKWKDDRARRFWLMSEDMNGRTLLLYAAQNGHLEVAMLLLDKGADINVAASDGRTPLHWASSNGHLEVAWLLLEKGADVNTANSSGLVPLHEALRNGHLEVAQILLDKGANVNAAKLYKWTPLHWASSNGHLEVAWLLLDKGADVNAADSDGWMPLYWAESNDHLEVAQLLLDKGTDINAANSSGWVPLYEASRNGHLEIARLLLNKVADIKAAKLYKWTPLHVASNNSHLKVARLLLDKGADVNAADSDGWMPLYWAESNGHLEVARLLLAATSRSLNCSLIRALT